MGWGCPRGEDVVPGQAFISILGLAPSAHTTAHPSLDPGLDIGVDKQYHPWCLQHLDLMM